jgi:hypothetical protein
VRLTAAARQTRVQLPQSGQAAASQLKHAHIFRQVDANGPNGSDAHVATALPWPGHPVRNGRQRFVEHGLAAAFGRTPQDQPSRQRLLAGAKEAHVIALRCGPPPSGPVQWT